MKVVMAFYKGNKLINKLISLWTKFFNPKTPPYSHVEIGIFREDKRIFFSSTNRNNSSGTRYIKPEKLFKHINRWDCYAKEYEDIDILCMLERADNILNKNYDWLGIAGFATPFGMLNDKDRWYCSEACHYVLTGKWKRRISPRRFYSEIIKLGFVKDNF